MLTRTERRELAEYATWLARTLDAGAELSSAYRC